MVKIKKVYKNHYTVIDNTILEDTSITWKAKGLFAYLWSQSDNWNFYEKEVVKHSADGISGLRSGLNELEKHGYLLRKRRREKGQVKESIWSLSESPNLDFLKQVKPDLEKPILEKPKQENQTLTNTNKNKYKNKQVFNLSSSISPQGDLDEEKEENFKNKFIAIINESRKEPSVPSPSEWASLDKLLRQVKTDDIRAVAARLKEQVSSHYIDKPWPYLLKMLREEK